MTDRNLKRIQAVYEVLTFWLKGLDRVLRYLLAFGMAVIMMAVIIHVCGRYFFGITYMGTMELVRYTMIWVSMVGAACAFGVREHVCINVLQGYLSERNWFLVRLLGNMVLLAFLVIMIIGGITISLRNWYQISLGMQIPMFFPYLAIPIGGVIIIPYILQDILSGTIEYFLHNGR